MIAPLTLNNRNALLKDLDVLVEFFRADISDCLEKLNSNLEVFSGYFGGFGGFSFSHNLLSFGLWLMGGGALTLSPNLNTGSEYQAVNKSRAEISHVGARSAVHSKKAALSDESQIKVTSRATVLSCKELRTARTAKNSSSGGKGPC